MIARVNWRRIQIPVYSPPIRFNFWEFEGAIPRAPMARFPVEWVQNEYSLYGFHRMRDFPARVSLRRCLDYLEFLAGRLNWSGWTWRCVP
jgi:hypothetical protein